MASARVNSESTSLDPGKLISSTFGRAPELGVVYFGDDTGWKFAKSVISSNSKCRYMYCGGMQDQPAGVEMMGKDPIDVKVDKPVDVVSVDSMMDGFSTVLYICLEGLLAADGLLCINGTGRYRFPLFRAMMKEGVVAPFGQNEFEDRGLVVFRHLTGKFARVI